MSATALVIGGLTLAGLIGRKISSDKEKKAQEILNAFNKKKISYDELISKLTEELTLNSEQRSKLTGWINQSLRGKNRDTLIAAEKEKQNRATAIEADIRSIQEQSTREENLANELAADVRNKYNILESL